MNEDFLDRKLRERADRSALRALRLGGNQVDFYSNDYLGIARNGLIEAKLSGNVYPHGSTGSRLLAGHYSLIENTEKQIALFHNAPEALIFNSGYDANVGLLACIAQRGDLIVYDKLCHASIRDGIRQSFAESVSFLHNDVADLEKKLTNRNSSNGRICFVVTESVFSMDGDMAPLKEITALCERFEANLIVDEAHATGVIGERGEGLVQNLGLENYCLARVHTFGKALGCHGAVILGSQKLRDFLINFCRPFIYSTAIPPVSVAAIAAAYAIFPFMQKEREFLKELIDVFDLPRFRISKTPIQCFIIPGNEKVKTIAGQLLRNNFDARPILYPTVPLGEERLRITLHSFNQLPDTKKLVSLLIG